MTPKVFVTAIACIFVVSLSAAIFISVRRPVPLIGAHVVFVGLAIGLAVNIVRGSKVDRWFTILAAVAGVIGICVNSNGQPALVAVGIAFSLCAVGLLTPFAGRHFAGGEFVEDDAVDLLTDSEPNRDDVPSRER